MAVQFQSYTGGPHGERPVVMPNVRPSFLGEIGSMLNQIGQIPAEMQQATLKKQLNDLLISSLSTPQTIQKTTNTPDTLVPKEDTTLQPIGESGQSLVGMMPATPESVGDLFTRQPGQPVTKTVTNPAFQDITDRMQAIGPAFGWKFPTPIEQIYAQYLAKASGLGELEKQKQQGRVEIQGMKGEQQQANIGTTYENKSKLETQRQEGRNELLDKNLESRQKIASEANQRMRDIAADRNLNDQQKIDKILDERRDFHNAEVKNYDGRTKVLQQQANSLEDIRNLGQINNFKDDLRTQLSQIDKIIAKGGQPEVAGELSQAVANYNDTVDKIKQLDPGSNLTKMQDMTAPGIGNWLKGITGMGTPSSTVVPAPAGTPPPRQPRTPATTPSPSIQAPSSMPTPGSTYRPSEISPEELQRRRNNIFQGLGK